MKIIYPYAMTNNTIWSRNNKFSGSVKSTVDITVQKKNDFNDELELFLDRYFKYVRTLKSMQVYKIWSK